MRKKLFKRGSAILIVMLLITVMATVALSVGYLTMAEVTMETSSQDSVVAYYAAESGIEDGLLRYRYDNNVEVGKFKDPTIDDTILDAVSGIRLNNLLCTNPKTNKDCVDRVNITDAGSATVHNQDASIAPADPLKQFYDMRIKYKADDTTVYSSVFTASDKELKKDESLTLTGFPNGSSVSFKFKAMDNSCAVETCFVEILGTPTGTEFVGLVGSTVASKPINALTPSSVLRIKYWYAVVGGSSSSVNYKTKAENTVGGVVTAIPLDSGYTTIESTGYYGSAKRRLQATIDRKTGKLLEIFDFTLNSIDQSIK